MFKPCLLIPAILIVGLGVAGAQEKTTAEVHLAAENVPEGLKAGARVDLKAIRGQRVTPSGSVLIADTLISGIEVAAVTKVETPKTPEQAMKVEFRLTKDQAAKIEYVKKPRAKTMVTKPGGRPRNRSDAGAAAHRVEEVRTLTPIPSPAKPGEGRMRVLLCNGLPTVAPH